MSDRTIKIILASILVLIIISLTTFLIFALMYPDVKIFKFGYSKSELIKTEEYNLSDITKITAESKSADIKVMESNGDTFIVKIYGDKDANPTVSVDNKELQIDYDFSTICFGFCFTADSLIEIYVPSSYVKDINLVSISGDIKVTNVSSENASFKTTSGDIWAEKLKDAEIGTVSGDVKINSVNNLDVKTTSGDIEISRLENSIKAETISGEIDINNLNLGRNSSIKTTSGDIDINTCNDNYGNSCNEIYFDTTTRSGDVNIAKNNRYSDITLKITTVSGDIDVR